VPLVLTSRLSAQLFGLPFALTALTPRLSAQLFGLPFALIALTPRLSAQLFGLLFALTALTPRLTGPLRAARTTAAEVDWTRHRRSAVQAGCFPAAGVRC